MSEVKNKGLDVVATLTVSFDEGDGGSAIEQVETHMLLDEGAHGLCRHSEAIAGYAVRDARIAAQEAQIKVLQSNANSWQSGYDEGRRMGGKHCMVTVDQLRAELAALTAKLDASKFCANVADDLRAELAAIRAQEPIGWYTDDHLTDKSSTTYDWGVPALSDTPVQQVSVPDVSAMARVLADRHADACNVNREDNWAIYGRDYIDDVTAIIAAAPAAPAADAGVNDYD